MNATTTNILVTAAIGMVPLGVAIVSVVGARSAQKATATLELRQAAAQAQAELEQTERKEARARADVEAQAYERARISYEKIVKDLEAQLDRNQRTVTSMQDQLERVLSQLASEQDVSNALRNQARVMHTQIGQLQQENERFRATIAELQDVADGLRSDLQRAGIVFPPLNPNSSTRPAAASTEE